MQDELLLFAGEELDLLELSLELRGRAGFAFGGVRLAAQEFRNLKTRIGYDEAGYPLLMDVSSTRWEDPNSNYRGMVTTTRSWSDITNNLYVETHAQYDRLGNLRKSWDGKGNLSQMEYSSTYDQAYPTKTISPIPGGNGSTTAFETTVIYDYNTGLPTSTTDANGQTSTMEYVDPLLRPTKVTAPNGHQTITEYGAGTTASTRFVKVSSQIDATNWKQGYSWFDGIGRTIKTQSVDLAGDVFSETLFDSVGRPWKTSNPYRTGDTKLWTENFYDTAGRPYKVKTPDGAEVETFYSLATTGSQIGTVVTVNDQAEKQRRSITNALGQLTRVDEPTDSSGLGAVNIPNQPTFYSYDTLNNLTAVNQGVQTRSFAYDSLSRLKQATNTESGVINYLYDNNSNLTSKTDARLVETNYIYDALNRVTQRNYTAPGGLANYQATPNVSYFYDNLPNAKGKLTKVSSSVSTTEYTSFDILGRVTSHKQTTDGTAYTTGYVYNLSGALIEETYPSTRKVKNVLDNEGDLAQVQSQKNATAIWRNYANSFVYTSAGAVSSMRLGNGKFENTQYNSRLQPVQIGLGASANAQNLLKLNYDYGTTDNNGNVKSQTITVTRSGQSPLVFNQTYVYDTLNRLKSAEEKTGTTTNWKQTFVFDRYGNRNFDEANTTTLPKNCVNNAVPSVCAADRKIYNPSITPSNNRLSISDNYAFDAAGNVTTDAEGRTFNYDAENKQKEAKNSSNVTLGTYFFDGDGKRVKKVVPSTGETTIFVYDAGGKLVAEYSTNLSSTPKVQYQTSDNLGTPRINTDQNGAVVSRSDYMPYGEEIIGLGGRSSTDKYVVDDVRQGFTGYINDGETGLDFAEARMYSNRLGRFTTTDPILNSGRPIIPKTWNRFNYSLNNPLKFVDPSGLYEYAANATDKEKKRFEKQLNKAKEQLAKIGKRYGKDSKEFTNAQRSLNVYGDPNKANGVIVGFGKTSSGKPGEAGGLIGADGKKSISVTFDLNQNKDDGLLLTTIAHEGSHVADRSDLADAMLSAQTGDPDFKTGAYMGVVNNDALNLTSNQTETTAYGVSSVFAEFVLKNEGGSQSSAGTTVIGGGGVQQDLSLAGVKIWNPSWATLDKEKVRANRSAAIADGLKKDSYYPTVTNNRFIDR